MKRSLKYFGVITVLIVGWLIYPVLENEYIELKEKWLIERNYSSNKDIFEQTLLDFDDYSRLSINFYEDNYIESTLYGDFDNDSLFPHSLQITIEDTNIYYYNLNRLIEIKTFNILNDTLSIVLKSDSTRYFANNWSIKYSGSSESQFFPLYLKALSLNNEQLVELKDKLRVRNCFGFRISKDNLFLHFRTPTSKLLIRSYSYCWFKNMDTKELFLEKILNYNKISKNLYWIYYEEIGIICFRNGGYHNIHF